MPDVQVDEAQLAQLQQAQALLDGLYRDPEHGMAFKAMLKRKHPNVSIPEIDTAAPIVAAMQQMRVAFVKELNDIKKAHKDDLDKRSEENEDRRFFAEIDRVVKDNSMTAKGREEMLALMKERKLPDPDAAAALYLARQPAPIKPSGFAPDRWNMFDRKDPDIKDMLDDTDAWFEREAEKAFREAA